MSQPRRILAVAALLAVACGRHHVRAQDESYKAEVVGATEEPQKAIKSLRALPGFTVELFAAEPMLANPVASPSTGRAVSTWSRPSVSMRA